MDANKERGVRATNRDFARYDQVAKSQTYGLAEGAREERFDDDYEVRTVDLSRWTRGDEGERAAFARELGAALEEIGFAILVGTGVDPDLYSRAEDEVRRLFTGHSPEQKLRFRAARHGAVSEGYFPIKETSDIHPDLVEGWVFCRRAFDLEGAPVQLADFWPDPAQEEVFRALCSAHLALVSPIMHAILTYFGCDPHLYDARLARTSFGLRLNYYPPIDAEGEASGAGRLLGHEDTDLFTLLPAPRSEGLQVLNRRSLGWVRLDAPPGAIVLNTGDYMQRITNDRLPSTTHRVAQPRSSVLRRADRVSFPLNVYVREDELLEVLPGLGEPRYPPVRAIEFHTKTTAKYYGDDYAVPGAGA